MTCTVASLALLAAASVSAQNNVPRPVNTNPPAAVNAAASNATGGGTPSNDSSVTGVARYHAGFRGPSGTTAPATPGEISRVGDDGSINANGAKLPMAQFRNNVLGIAAGTPINVRLQTTVDSGHVANGQTLRGTLAQPVAGLPAGSAVELSVVSSAAAGQMKSSGELSVQVVSIAGKQVLSQVITAEGQEGSRLTPDAAPTRGTEAQLGPETPLVLPAA